SLWDHLLKQVFRINSQSLSVDPVAAELISNPAGGDGRLLVVIGSSDSEGSLVEQTPGLVRHLPRRLLASLRMGNIPVPGDDHRYDVRLDLRQCRSTHGQLAHPLRIEVESEVQLNLPVPLRATDIRHLAESQRSQTRWVSGIHLQLPRA